MANLNYEILQSLEELFGMRSGYVLDFSNDSFQRFIKGIINIDIYNDKGYEKYCSKANKLRQIFEIESNAKVAKLVISLLNYYEDYKLKEDNLIDYDKKKIYEIKEAVKELEQTNDEKIAVPENLDKLIQKISTRNAEFDEMALDEKIKEIGNLIENLLKKDGKFIKMDYDSISLGFISEDDVKELRKKLSVLGILLKKVLMKEKAIRRIKKKL